MQIKSVYIGQYKNLKAFKYKFNSQTSIETLVGANGSGKSNFIEAIIEIFSHIDDSNYALDWSYEIEYEIKNDTYKGIPARTTKKNSQ